MSKIVPFDSRQSKLQEHIVSNAPRARPICVDMTDANLLETTVFVTKSHGGTGASTCISLLNHAAKLDTILIQIGGRPRGVPDTHPVEKQLWVKAENLNKIDEVMNFRMSWPGCIAFIEIDSAHIAECIPMAHFIAKSVNSPAPIIYMQNAGENVFNFIGKVTAAGLTAPLIVSRPNFPILNGPTTIPMPYLGPEITVPLSGGKLLDELLDPAKPYTYQRIMGECARFLDKLREHLAHG